MLQGKDFISTYKIDPKVIMAIFSKASFFKRLKSTKPLDLLEGKVIINIFFEPSTRTHYSFEIAEKLLGAKVINFSKVGSSIAKGESLSDTVRTFKSLGAHLIVVRHPESGSAKFISDTVDIPVINAGDGAHEHPTQTLLDLFTLYERIGDLKNKKIVIVGDILHSRTTRSTIFAMNALGGKVVLCGPPTLIPDIYLKLKVEINYNLNEAIKDADAIRTARIQKERFKNFFIQPEEYFKNFRIDKKRIKIANEKILIMHGAPMRRGEEITTDVVECPNSVIFEQMENGVYIRMALLSLILGE